MQQASNNFLHSLMNKVYKGECTNHHFRVRKLCKLNVSMWMVPRLRSNITRNPCSHITKINCSLTLIYWSHIFYFWILYINIKGTLNKFLYSMLYLRDSFISLRAATGCSFSLYITSQCMNVPYFLSFIQSTAAGNIGSFSF